MGRGMDLTAKVSSTSRLLFQTFSLVCCKQSLIVPVYLLISSIILLSEQNGHLMRANITPTYLKTLARSRVAPSSPIFASVYRALESSYFIFSLLVINPYLMLDLLNGENTLSCSLRYCQMSSASLRFYALLSLILLVLSPPLEIRLTR